MGIVYLAEQTDPIRRRVALKVIKPGMDTANVLARFEADHYNRIFTDEPAINTSRVIAAFLLKF